MNHRKAIKIHHTSRWMVCRQRGYCSECFRAVIQKWIRRGGSGKEVRYGPDDINSVHVLLGGGYPRKHGGETEADASVQYRTAVVYVRRAEDLRKVIEEKVREMKEEAEMELEGL